MKKKFVLLLLAFCTSSLFAQDISCDETAFRAQKCQAPLRPRPIYNLAGQKVGASYKGIVIQNGKKRIVH